MKMQTMILTPGQGVKPSFAGQITQQEREIERERERERESK